MPSPMPDNTHELWREINADPRDPNAILKVLVIQHRRLKRLEDMAHGLETSRSTGPSYRAFLGEKPCSDPTCECHPQEAAK